MVMISVLTATSGIYHLDFTEGMTPADALQKIVNDNDFEIIGGQFSYDFYDTVGGNVIPKTTPIADDRRYYLNAWLKKKGVHTR